MVLRGASSSASTARSTLKHKAAVHWFRKGLRLHDNPGLLAAISNAATVLPVYVLDPEFVDPQAVGPRRFNFLVESLRDLDSSLRERNSRLFVTSGDPVKVIPSLLQRWGASLLTYERETEPYARERDRKVHSWCTANGVSVDPHVSLTLYDPDDVFRAAGGKIPTSYGSFTKLLSSKLGIPPRPVAAPSPQQPLCAIPWRQYITDVSGKSKQNDERKGEVGGIQVMEMSDLASLASSAATYSAGTEGDDTNGDLIESQTLVATRLQEYARAVASLVPAVSPFSGGESVALSRLASHVVARKEWVFTFEKPKTVPNPADVTQPSTTVLSPYLSFGCLSVRHFWHTLQDDVFAPIRRNNGAGRVRSKPPVSLDGQLIWREFFHTQGRFVAHFDRMKGSGIARQIPWRPTSLEAARVGVQGGLPVQVTEGQRRERNGETSSSSPSTPSSLPSPIDADAEACLQAWKEARTGFPWIDAAMTQLHQEGWIHHLARHSLACFLTRGDCFVSWESGARVFNRLLLDADWSLNSGNWLWLSASAYFYQFARVYSPISFPQKTDKKKKGVKRSGKLLSNGSSSCHQLGSYVRHYLPQLKSMPDKYIYEPWKAPLAVQKAAGCVIGKDYPHPIVDHQTVRKRNLGWMAEAYQKARGAKGKGEGGKKDGKKGKAGKRKKEGERGDGGRKRKIMKKKKGDGEGGGLRKYFA